MGSGDSRGASHLCRGGPVPVLPVCLVEPLWVQFSALLPERPRVSPTHPLGCHRQRIDDRVVFEHVIAALVHGSGHERIALLSVVPGNPVLARWPIEGLSRRHPAQREQAVWLAGTARRSTRSPVLNAQGLASSVMAPAAPPW